MDGSSNLVRHCVYGCVMRSFLTLLCCIPLSLAAQHCGYDFASLIVVRPFADGDTVVIDGLRITLLDSNNLPVVHYDKPWQLFHRNDEQNLRHSRRGHFDVPDYFPFAQDNYVLVIPTGYDTSKMKVLVQDERTSGTQNKRGDRRPLYFKQQVVPLTVFDSYRLCGTYDAEVYPELSGRPRYHPVDITLYPR